MFRIDETLRCPASLALRAGTQYKTPDDEPRVLLRDEEMLRGIDRSVLISKGMVPSALSRRRPLGRKKNPCLSAGANKWCSVFPRTGT